MPDGNSPSKGTKSRPASFGNGRRVVCRICEIQFLAYHPRTLMCSPKCADTNEKAANAARHKARGPEQKIRRQEYAAEYYQKNSDYVKAKVKSAPADKKRQTDKRRDRIKIRARTLFRYHVSKGNIVRMPCRDCGATEVQGHHPDYSKPLDVIWLCSTHHAEEHRRLNRENLRSLR